MADITLTLKHDDALVFYEWLVLLEEKSVANLLDEAEQRVLWRIEGQLESILPDVVMEDYKSRVAAAKGRV